MLSERPPFGQRHSNDTRCNRRGRRGLDGTVRGGYGGCQRSASLPYMSLIVVMHRHATPMCDMANSPANVR